MASLGETQLMIHNYAVGWIRVLDLHAVPSLRPRVGFTVGIRLEPSRAAAFVDDSGDATQLTGLAADFRSLRDNRHITELVWSGTRVEITSATPSAESQVRLAGDLDPYVIEEIEKQRDGRAPEFLIQFWPTIRVAGRLSPATSDPAALKLSRDDWIAFRASALGGIVDILEIAYPKREADAFRRAEAKLTEARDHLQRGNYDQAVALCRNVIEALMRELPPGETDPIAEALRSRTDQKRAAEYKGIVSRLKQLAAMAHHEFGAPVAFTRVEALFMVRTTAAFLALLGGLLEQW